jgi:hypothetical protein
MWLAPDNGKGTEFLTYQATVPPGELISRSAAVLARRFVVLTGIEHAIVGCRKMRQPTTSVQPRWRRNRLRRVVRGAGPCLVLSPSATDRSMGVDQIRGLVWLWFGRFRCYKCRQHALESLR